MQQTIKSYDEKLQEVLEQLQMSEFYMKRVQETESFKKISAMDDGDCKEVNVFNLTPKTGSIKLVPFYDIHYGLKACNKSKLDAYIDYVCNTEDCYTFLGGDSCETATRESIGLGLLEEELHSGEQRRSLTNKLKPLAEKGKILFGIPGNHEMRSHRFNEDNPMAEICYDLGIPFNIYQSYSIFNVNSVQYNVVAFHGCGNGGSLASKIGAGTRAGSFIAADLYISGHSHTRGMTEDSQIDFSSGATVKNRRVYVVGGSLVNYFGIYPEQRMMQPSCVGLVLISLDGSTKYVSVTV